MNNQIIWFIIVVSSVVFGVIHYFAGYNKELPKENQCYKFLEFWRHSINYFIALVIAYYFASMRLCGLSQGNSVSVGDAFLGMVFLVGIFGWLPYFTKNITEGINVIINRVLIK